MSPVIHVSAEAVICRDFKLNMGRDGADHAKINFDETSRLKRQLERAEPNFYDFCGGLRPTSEYARTMAGGVRIANLVQKFGTYLGTQELHVDQERITRFLDQFPEDLVGDVLAALEGLKFLDRPTLGTDFARFVTESAPDCITAGLTTDPGKSANLLSYCLNDASGPLRQRPLAEALSEGTKVCLFDDFILSGKRLGPPFSRC